MTVQEIVKKYLEDNNYDGLWSSLGECACLVDDLAPCGEMMGDCEAGYRVPCDCGEHDFHIVPEKPDSKHEGN